MKGADELELEQLYSQQFTQNGTEALDMSKGVIREFQVHVHHDVCVYVCMLRVSIGARRLNEGMLCQC